MNTEPIGDELNELDAPIPEGLDTPGMYWMMVMPIATRRKTSGGIILPDTVREGEQFMNCIGRICALGAGCFKSQKMSIDLQMTEKDFPKVGQLIRYSGVNIRHWYFKGVMMNDVRDDMFRSFVSEENVREMNYRFHN